MPTVINANSFIKLINYGQEFSDQLTRHILITKDKQWSHEDEVRFFINLKYCLKKESGTFVNILPEEINAIFCGIDTNEEAIEAIIDVVKSNVQLNHVKIFKAKKKRYRFGLDFLLIQ